MVNELPTTLKRFGGEKQNEGPVFPNDIKVSLLHLPFGSFGLFQLHIT